jgi:hypothetical protein
MTANPWNRYRLPAEIYVTARSRSEALRLINAALDSDTDSIRVGGSFDIDVYHDDEMLPEFVTEDAIPPPEGSYDS